MEQNNNGDNHLTDNEVKNIYKKLQFDPIDIDLINNTEFINKEISNIFDSKFLFIDSKELICDKFLLNQQFLKLIQYLKEKHNYKNVSLIFIIFCDYFDIEYNKTYICLHEKLQDLIKESAKNIIGNDVYQNMVNKTKPKDYKITTIFDLIKK